MKRRQVPLAPGFAIMAHKAQGLTLPNIIIDIANCRGTEPPYVMVSRCTDLDGLLIMRPFPISKITCRRSQEARDEFSRLNLLRLQTITSHGTWQEQEAARSQLVSKNGDSAAVEELFTNEGSKDPKWVRELVQKLQNVDAGAYYYVLTISVLNVH